MKTTSQEKLSPLEVLDLDIPILDRLRTVHMAVTPDVCTKLAYEYANHALGACEKRIPMEDRQLSASLILLRDWIDGGSTEEKVEDATRGVNAAVASYTTKATDASNAASNARINLSPHAKDAGIAADKAICAACAAIAVLNALHAADSPFSANEAAFNAARATHPNTAEEYEWQLMQARDILTEIDSSMHLIPRRRKTHYA